jgi:hypothetical protein
MKKLLAVFTLSLTAFLAEAQETKQLNNLLSAEIGKTGLIYNLSIDHHLKKKQSGFRLFIGSNFNQFTQAFSAGVGFYRLSGRKNSQLETGLDLGGLTVQEISEDQRGFVLLNPDYQFASLSASVNIGYRYTGRKSVFRIGFAPTLISEGLFAGGYISFGVRF